MNKEKKKEKKKNTINADEKLEKINLKRLMKKKSRRRKKILDILVFKDLVVKNSNAQTSAKYYIDNTMLFSSVIENFSFESENVLKKQSNM